MIVPEAINKFLCDMLDAKSDLSPQLHFDVTPDGEVTIFATKVNMMRALVAMQVIKGEYDAAIDKIEQDWREAEAKDVTPYEGSLNCSGCTSGITCPVHD